MNRMRNATRLKWYLAGKIGPDDWRRPIVRGLGKLTNIKLPGPFTGMGTRSHCIQDAVLGVPGWDYVGPYYVSMHGSPLCGQHTAPSICREHGYHDGTNADYVHGVCLDAICECDVLFAWIDSRDAYGTLVEIGYAAAWGKQVIIGYGGGAPVEDLWFADSCQTQSIWSTDTVLTPREALIWLYHDQIGWKRAQQESNLLAEKVQLENELAQLAAAPSALPEAVQPVRLDPQRTFTGLQKKEIFMRSNGHCVGCGAALGEVDWHADHIFPHARGGRTEVVNGQALCPTCNLRKSSRILTVDSA